MSEFVPVRTIEDLNRLDVDEMLLGYWAGRENAAEPGSDKSRSYWHGWRNGMTDFGHKKSDSAQSELARHYVGTYRGLQ